jgi:hypothetical protein
MRGIREVQRMTYAINVKGVEGDWQLVLPDYVTLRQGAGNQPIHFDGSADPIVMDVHYTPDMLLASVAHGIVSIDAIDLPGAVNDANAANGLRGTLQVNFWNQLGAPMNPLQQGSTMIEYVGAAGDRFADDPSGHPLYAHFHGVEVADYPGLLVNITTETAGFQPAVGTPGAPNHINIAGTIPTDVKTAFGPITIHQRDTNAGTENFFFSFFPTDTGVPASTIAAAQARFAAAPALQDYTNIDATPAPDSRYYFIFRADNTGDFYTGFVTDNTGKYTFGSIIGTAKGQYQIMYEQPFGFDISTGKDPNGNPWGPAYQDGIVHIQSYHDGASGADYNTTYFDALYRTNATIASGYRGLGSEVDYIDVGGQWAMIGRGGEYLV